MTTYFSQTQNVTDIKKLFRELALANHPDRGGDTAVMQEINRQYQNALAGKHESKDFDDSGVEHTYYYNAEHEEAIAKKIDELLAMKLSNVEIWLIGKWIWVQGETKGCRDALKTAGLWWHSKRLAWYWKPYEGKSSYNSRADLAHLADKYGAKLHKADDSEKAVAIA